MKIIQYRTYALRLKDSGNAEYLQLFVEKMKTDKRFRHVNLAFFLNYYSQKEFTYAEVVGMSKEMKGKISGVMLHRTPTIPAKRKSGQAALRKKANAMTARPNPLHIIEAYRAAVNP